MLGPPAPPTLFLFTASRVRMMARTMSNDSASRSDVLEGWQGKTLGDTGSRSLVAERCILPPLTTAADILRALRPELRSAQISP